MAKFTFYASDSDSRALLEALLEPGDLKVTPDLNYRTPRATSYTNVSERLLERIGTKKLLYVTGPFSVWPTCFRRARGAQLGRPFYYIDQFRTGPALLFLVPICTKQDSVYWHLVPGEIWYAPYYWDDAKNQRIAPSVELKAAFADVVRRLKRKVKRRKFLKTIWIGENAASLLDSCDALILIDGKWFNCRGEFVKSNLPAHKFV